MPQGFLEMASEEAAVSMVNYYTSAPPTVRNQPIFIQYSTHRELKTDNLTNQVRSGQIRAADVIFIKNDEFTPRVVDRGWRCMPSAQQQCILGPWRQEERGAASLPVRVPS